MNLIKDIKESRKGIEELNDEYSLFGVFQDSKQGMYQPIECISETMYGCNAGFASQSWDQMSRESANQFSSCMENK